MESALYVVATPIGNLGDITQRALDTLAAVDVVAAEDTRRSGQLLAHFGIERRLVAYHEHSDAALTARLAGRVAAGEAVALVSDAGTPLVSDPGFRLVRAVQETGGRVVPIPGACAAMAALSAAGLASDRFQFEGFLPARAAQRQRRIAELAGAECTLIFYEAPHRLLDTLEDLLGGLGPDREAVLARELTKRFETLHRAPLGELQGWVAADPDQQRGEVVLLVERAPRQARQLDPPLVALLEALAAEMPAKRAAALLSDYSGIRKKQLYEYLLSRRQQD